MHSQTTYTSQPNAVLSSYKSQRNVFTEERGRRADGLHKQKSSGQQGGGDRKGEGGAERIARRKGRSTLEYGRGRAYADTGHMLIQEYTQRS